RVDSVHQGDKDGKKGVYHVNAVDEVTQWEVVVTVERITDQFMIPALTSILDQFPFKISGFHSDNGSEYINQRVAALLNDSLIRLTKSRPRHSNDNALAESKNNSVVRKNFGYIHVPQKHALLMDEFNIKHLNPCLNFHRPCHFPTVEINDKGKQARRYIQKDMKTPFEKLASLEHADDYLKDSLTIAALETVAKKQSDLEAWEVMQKARCKLFDDIFALSPSSKRYKI
ncbi:MAG: integrase, partial [Ghiorsea sp.]